MKEKDKKKKLTLSVSAKKSYEAPRYTHTKNKTSVVIEKKVSRRGTERKFYNKDYNLFKFIGYEGRQNVLKKFDVDKMCNTTFTEYKKLIELS